MRISGTLRISVNRFVAFVCVVCLVAQVASAQNSTITVQVDKPGANINSPLFGLFFEDINFAADGGLYPERVKNRSFEFPDPWMGWKQIVPKDSNGTLLII